MGPEAQTSSHAATALALAAEIDSAGNSATSKSMCAKVLLETLAKLRELSPPAVAADKLDDLAAKRQKRRNKAAG
jgi:broad specificity phosphatase PhoE